MKLNRLSLNVVGLNRIGLNQIGSPSRGSSSGTDRPYIDPEVLASLKAVCICYGKSNDDPDRAVVKNLVDPDNPFVISNAAYDKMSSYGGYEFAKFDNTLDWYNTEGNDSVEVVSRNGHSITLKRLTGPNFWYFQNSTFRGLISNVIPFKVNSNKNITVIWDVHGLSISEGKDKSVRVQELVLNPNEDNYTNLKTLNEEELAQIDISTNSLYYLLWFDLSTLAVDEEVTIEMLPLFEGAFVTDGIDDLITSTKTVQEMGITDEVTVVSMIHQIDKPSNFITTNNIRTSGSVVGRNAISLTDKTGIYGWYKDNIQGSTINVINNILGDKANYTASASSNTNLSSKFSVVGYISNGSIVETSQVAWYWTIIANKVLTTDQINQVIAYFNLDRTLKSDIYCNIAKQGITNENHAEFGDTLIDFSGNGRDIQLNNIAWKGDSGIGKYEVDFASLNYNNTTSVFTATYKSCSISKIIKDGVGNIFYNWGQTLAAINSTKIQVIGLDEIGAILEFTYLDESGNSTTKQYSTDGIYDLPASAAYQGDSHNTNFRFSIRGYIGDCDITITQIPSHAGALLLNGGDDFGKVTGMPIYKDYTVVADYERLKIGYIEDKGTPAILSKSYTVGQGAFLMNLIGSTGEHMNAYTFGNANSAIFNDLSKKIYYQSKYKMQGFDMTIGSGVDGDSLWLGVVRDNDSRFFNGAIYSLMSFPYSMSEFLIERQLKKHKLGTLYPDMVEFRPIVKSNSEYQVVNCYIDTLPAVVGNYYPINSKLRIAVTTKGAADEVTSLTVNGVSLGTPSVNGNRFTFNGTLSDKSPQKINITIDEYIRFEDIVQPYPVLLRFKDENGNEVSWGGKFRVGSTITIIGSAADSNLLPNIYNIFGLLLNGNQVTSSKAIVEKTMVFKAKSAYIFDDNEPKCILSPRLLRIPNSSYKILGYIPDISGHGNHGKINNSAYAEGSGVNEDGSYQFDGVDDFITIPTTVGGKQVLMKVNWQSIAGTAILYDQRTNGGFAIFNRDFDTNENKVPAYRARNIGGSTYIDGILNKYIYASELKNITHNIVELHDPKLNIGTLNPKIGSSYLNSNYTQMSLYDFMLFDEISTDDKIKELNKYVGIEGNVWGILTQLSNSTLISNETLIKNE